MNKGNGIELPKEFANGPWITAQRVMDWFDISKDHLKIWRHRGVLAYSSIGGITMYNEPWILWQLKTNWRWKRPEGE